MGKGKLVLATPVILEIMAEIQLERHWKVLVVLAALAPLMHIDFGGGNAAGVRNLLKNIVLVVGLVSGFGNVLFVVLTFDHQTALICFQFEVVQALVGWEEPWVICNNLANFVAFRCSRKRSCTTEALTHHNALVSQLKVGPVSTKLCESVLFVDLFDEASNFFASSLKLLVALIVAFVCFRLTVKHGAIGRKISAAIIMRQ